MKVAVLYSGGKDSNYALHWAFTKGFEVTCLITLKARHEDSWMFHVPNIEITKLQAKALNLPQIFLETSGKRDEELIDMKRAFIEARENYGIEGVVTGALLSDYQRMNINIVAHEVHLRTYSPLWRKDQERYMLELVDYGFKIVITSIDTYGLSPKYLGKVLTRSDVLEIIDLARKYGFNPAFEGGEAETLVVDAPLFRKELNIKCSRVVKVHEYSWRLVIEDVELRDKY